MTRNSHHHSFRRKEGEAIKIETDYTRHDRNKEVKFSLDAEESLTGNVSFSGRRHKQLYVFDVSGDNGTMLLVFDNEGEHGKPKGGAFTAGQAGNARTISILGRNDDVFDPTTSNSRIPDGSRDQRGRPTKIGFEDGVDGNYQDIEVTISITRNW